MIVLSPICAILPSFSSGRPKNSATCEEKSAAAVAMVKTKAMAAIRAMRSGARRTGTDSAFASV